MSFNEHRVLTLLEGTGTLELPLRGFHPLIKHQAHLFPWSVQIIFRPCWDLSSIKSLWFHEFYGGKVEN